MCVLEAVERGHQEGSQLKLDEFEGEQKEGVRLAQVLGPRGGIHSLATGRLGSSAEPHASRGPGRPELVSAWEEGGKARVLGRGGKIKVETDKVEGGSFDHREVFLLRLSSGCGLHCPLCSNFHQGTLAVLTDFHSSPSGKGVPSPP